MSNGTGNSSVIDTLVDLTDDREVEKEVDTMDSDIYEVISWKIRFINSDVFVNILYFLWETILDPIFLSKFCQIIIIMRKV